MRRRIFSLLSGAAGRRRGWGGGGLRPGPLAGLLVAVLAAAVAPSRAPAQQAAAPPNLWIGQRVITQYGTVLQVDDKPMDDEERGKTLARGKEQSTFRVYKVEQAKGSWLWIVAEGSGVKGWVKAESLIPFDQAIDHITNQIRANPTASSKYNWRGLVWCQKKEYDIAIGDYNEAIRLDPGYAAVYNNRGNAWRDKREYDKAISDYNEAIRLDPEDALAHNNRGIAWYYKLEYDKAIADYNEAIRLDPGYADAHYNRGVVWIDEKEYDKAIADYNEAIRLDPGVATAYYNRGLAWGDKGEFDKALADFTEAIRLDPGYALAHGNRGIVWYYKQEYDKAIADYNEAIRLDPGYAAVYNNRGNVWNDKREYDKAIADFNEAIRLDPNDEGPHFGKALTRLSMGSEEVVADARAAVEKGDWKETRPIYAAIVGHLGARRVKKDDAAKVFLDDADAHADKTLWPYPVARFLRGEIDEKALFELATDDGKMTEVRCYVGFDQLLNGRTAEARENFQWVKDHGTPGFVEVGLAIAELDRLEKETAAVAP